MDRVAHLLCGIHLCHAHIYGYDDAFPESSVTGMDSLLSGSPDVLFSCCDGAASVKKRNERMKRFFSMIL